MEAQDNFTKLNYILAGTGIIAFFVLIILYVFHYFKQQMFLKKKAILELESLHHVALIKSQIKGEEEAKLNLTVNLHDELGTYLTLLKINLGDALPMQIDDNKIKLVNNLIDNCMLSFKNVYNNIIPVTLKTLGLQSAIDEYIELLNTSQDNRVKLKVEGICAEFPIEMNLSIYRIIKESFNNILKHSDAKSVDLLMQFSKNDLNILLSHNGNGLVDDDLIELRKINKCFGLNSIESRILSLNGFITYFKKNKYFIQIKIPYTQ